MAEFDSIRSSTRSDSYVNIDSGLRAHMNKVYGLMAVAMIINWFTQSPGLEFAINVLGVLIFAGLTAYDTQNIKNTYLSIRSAPNGEEIAARAGILGALSLYINFLNMFMFLLQFMGNRE